MIKIKLIAKEGYRQSLSTGVLQGEQPLSGARRFLDLEAHLMELSMRWVNNKAVCFTQCLCTEPNTPEHYFVCVRLTSGCALLIVLSRLGLGNNLEFKLCHKHMCRVYSS